jgi:hypothetical protein
MLAGKLSELVQQALGILDVKKGETKPMIMTFIRHKITEFHVDETGSRWQATDVPFERIDMSSFIFDLVQKEIVILPIFKEITEIIVKDYPDVFQSISPDINKKGQAEFWLGNFVRRVLNEKLENRLTEPHVTELITIFESELNRSALECSLTSYVSGLHLKTDLILLDENTVIRKLKASDLEYEYYAFTPFLSPRFEMQHPSAVVEIKMRVKDEPELSKKLEKTLLTLRLFRLGSIRSLRNDNTKLSVIWPFGTGSAWPNSGFAELRNYVVQDNEIDDFKKFFKTLFPIVQNEKPEESAGLSIAITRYNNALLDQVDIERKLMTTMMALESLYSMPSDKGEIGYRISLRVAKLLSFLGFKPTEVRKNVEKSYYVRSRVAHGVVVDVKKVGNVADLLNTLLEYLRLSLVVFIFLRPPQKNRFVASVDSSLVDMMTSIEIKSQLVKIAEQIPNFPISS